MATLDSKSEVSAQCEESCVSPLTSMLMSSKASTKAPKSLSWREKLDRFMFIYLSQCTLAAICYCFHALVFSLGAIYSSRNKSFTTATSTSAVTLPIASAAGLVLHIDVALILLPVCRSLVASLRETRFHVFLSSGDEVSFHKILGFFMVVFAFIHAIAHWVNFAHLAVENNQGLKAFLLTIFATGPGWSGHIMLVSLVLIAATSVKWVGRNDHQQFWSTHHISIVFFVFWSIHGAFCTTKADRSSFKAGIGTFWQYWMCGGFIYLAERILREVLARHKAHISKVIQHPSNVVEIQIRKKHATAKVGQYIYLGCPEVSLLQSRCFALTSAPEEDYLSVHIPCSDCFTKSFAASLGCKFDHPKDGNLVQTSSVIGIDEKAARLDIDPTIRKPLPPVSIDGPFGKTIEDIFDMDVVIFVGAGHNTMSCASILKSIWYRMNIAPEKTKLRKVYFFWLCDDIRGSEWFKSLMMAIEAQDIDNIFEIHSYLTASYKFGKKTGLAGEDLKVDKDTFAGLRIPTIHGSPNWDVILAAIQHLHPQASISVLPRGPVQLMGDLRVMCRRWCKTSISA